MVLEIVNKEHPSVCMIKENKLTTDDLNFKPVSSNFVSKQINKLNINNMISLLSIIFPVYFRSIFQKIIVEDSLFVNFFS
jgi:hypothetical protein